MSNDQHTEHLYALIFCGGGGTRLWPYSREKKPKQFLKFDSDKTLIRLTYERIAPLIPSERIFVITLADYVDEVKEYLPEIPQGRIIVEPARRDTLMAAGLGALYIKHEDPEAIIANIWSDQLIKDDEGYRSALVAGAKTAYEQKQIVTTAVTPAYAHPGLEYVKKGELHSTIDGTPVYKVDEFIERPSRSGIDPDTLIADQNNLWHIGLWIWDVNVFLNTVKQNTPETFAQLEKIDKAINTHNLDQIEEQYNESPVVQIDMAISKNASLFVVHGEYEWLDVGDFGVMWRLSKKDEHENALLLHKQSEWRGVDTTGTIVLSEGKRLVATIGLTDMIVVSTNDAVLVARREDAQKVKEIVDQLKKEEQKDFL